MRSLIALILVTSLAACVSTQYYKADGTPSEFEAAKQQCIYEAQLHVNYDPIMWPMLVQQCLRVKGWNPR